MEYLLKASGIIALFYTIYVLCLRNVTFFKANRFFLLSGLLFALVFPLITIPIYIEYAPVDNAYTSIDVSNIFIENSIAENTAPLEHADTAYSFKDYALLFYVIGVIVFLVRFIIQLVSLASIIAKNKRVQHDKYTYVTVTKDTPPFSFFNWIVYNPNHFSTLELEQILTHEKAHANQIHSIDILIAQFVSILLWFNPFMYLYTKSLKQNLEFLADNTALHFLKSKKDYQYILLKTSAKNHQLAFGNNFYNSFIKKRIIMLQTSKSKNINFIKYLLILPVLGWFLMSFNSKTIYIEKEEASSTYNDPVLQFEIKSSFTDKDFIAFKKDLADLGFNFEIKSIERKQNNLVSAIDFVISKNNTEGRYRIARGMPIAPVVIQYFENKNKFIINTENFNSTLKELEKSQNTVQIVIDKNSSIEAIETKKKFLKDNYNLDLEFKVIKKDTHNDLKTYAMGIGRGKIKRRITTNSDKPLIINYNPKTNEIIHYKINENGDPEYGGNYVLASEKKHLILNYYNDADLKTSVKELHKKGIDLTFKDVIRNAGDTIIGISVLVKSKTGSKLNYQQYSGNPITPVAISYFDNGTLNNIGPSHFKRKNFKTTKTKRTSLDTLNTNLNIPKNALYIINEEISTRIEFEHLDTNNISSISILKGYSATFAFGDKGKNGVVLITTKNKNKWEVKQSSNINIIHATKDTIYVYKKLDIIREFTNDLEKTPLFIFDGEEISKEELQSIDEFNVERIQVLKPGQSNLEKYGEKGKNGVVQITLKTERSKTPFIKVVGDAKFIVNGIEVSSEEFHKIPSNQINSIKATSTSNGQSTIKVSTNKK